MFLVGQVRPFFFKFLPVYTYGPGPQPRASAGRGLAAAVAGRDSGRSRARCSAAGTAAVTSPRSGVLEVLVLVVQCCASASASAVLSAPCCGRCLWETGPGDADGGEQARIRAMRRFLEVKGTTPYEQDQTRPLSEVCDREP